jgi:nucleotide-binding universal stress UspA family protein
MPMKRVLVGHDKSDQSDDALRFGLEIARISGAELIVATTFEPAEAELPPGHDEELRVAQTDQLASRVRSIAGQSSGWRVRLLDGGPADGLLAACRAEDVDALVLGARQTDAGLRLGSVVNRVARRTAIPLVIVPTGTAPDAITLLLIGSDDSPAGEKAALWGREAALVLGARAESVEVFPSDRTPADALVDTAREMDADLLVIGAKGKSDALDLRLGSTAIAVLHRADRPVVVVPEEAETADF